MVHCHPYTTLGILPKHKKQSTNQPKKTPKQTKNSNKTKLKLKSPATTVIVIPSGHLTSCLVLLNESVKYSGNCRIRIKPGRLAKATQLLNTGIRIFLEVILGVNRQKSVTTSFKTVRNAASLTSCQLPSPTH